MSSYSNRITAFCSGIKICLHLKLRLSTVRFQEIVFVKLSGWEFLAAGHSELMFGFKCGGCSGIQVLGVVLDVVIHKRVDEEIAVVVARL